MRYIKLGTTGMDVSPIAIGAMTYGEPDRGHPVWSKGEEEARPLIRHALEAGGEADTDPGGTGAPAGTVTPPGRWNFPPVRRGPVGRHLHSPLSPADSTAPPPSPSRG
jgi:hypothetical protein